MTLRRRRVRGMIALVRDSYGYTPGRCAYCGRHLRVGIVCQAHSDLLHRDPMMIALKQHATVASNPAQGVESQVRTK